MKIKAVCAVLAPVLAVGAPFMWPKLSAMRHSMLAPSHPMGAMAAFTLGATTPPPASGRPLSELSPTLLASGDSADLVKLQTGIELGVITAEFIGNGRDMMKARLFNASGSRVTVRLDAGQMLDAGLNAVVIARGVCVQLDSGQIGDLALVTVATRTGNKTAEQNYKLSYGKLPQLDKLLGWLPAHEELSIAAIQTAVLAITENLPLSAVCKFTPAASESRSRFNTDAFRVETGEIIAALGALREIGIPDASVAMTVDPQLKIEAMIEPLCRAVAMKYYGIAAENEWAFWQNQLLNGDLSTRHYALYGIARFYPDIALQMLPKWARESKTSPVFRLAAVQALADTHRPDALPVLRQLADEFGIDSEFGRASAGAAQYLDEYLSNANTRQASVTFRSAPRTAQF